MIPTLADRAFAYWSAAKFLRRAPDRDNTTALNVMRHIAKITTGTVQSRAIAALKEFDHGTDEQPPGAE